MNERQAGKGYFLSMNINEMFALWQKCSSDFVDTEYSFLNSLDQLLNKSRQERQDFDKKNFNLFSLISEAYRPGENVYEKENPNSEILKILLDPNTSEIGNPIVLERFFEFIGLKEHKKFFPDLSTVKIERERHRIDIYIHNDENSVIVESKLYGALNQDFQLARYYLKSKEDGCTVRKIVYLTLNPIQKLDLHDLYKPSKEKKYSQEEQKKYCALIPEIEPLITYISARNDNDEKSLSVFFDRCSKENKIKNELLKIILKQYSKLLIKLAGEQIMTSAEKKLISKIYESEESIKNALEFYQVWDRKDDTLREIFADKFKEKHKDWSYDSHEWVFYKEVNRYRLFIYKYAPEIGFWSEKFKKSEREKLRKVLENLDIGGLNIDGEIKDNENWVYMDFIYNNEPINSYFESLDQALKNLESAVLQLD